MPLFLLCFHHALLCSHSQNMSGIAGKLLCICSHSISLLSEIHSHKMDKALIVPSMLLPPVLPENVNILNVPTAPYLPGHPREHNLCIPCGCWHTYSTDLLYKSNGLLEYLCRMHFCKYCNYLPLKISLLFLHKITIYDITFLLRSPGMHPKCM